MAFYSAENLKVNARSYLEKAGLALHIQAQKPSEIWAVAGGKGGTGKSFLVSCIGNYLAKNNRKVVVVDADLGGANLHSFFGINKPKASLTDFFEGRRPLSELIVESGIPNMGLLTGPLNFLAADSIKYTSKLKFFRHIKKLNARYIVVDLGAGTHFSTVDTYLVADKMIVVLVPEITAIENAYFFLNNVLFRKLLHAFSAHGLKNLVLDTWKNREQYGIKNLNQLTVHLRGRSSTIEEIIQNEFEGFKVHIVLNRVKSEKDARIGISIKSICLKYFGLKAQYLGYVENDEVISECINSRRPYMESYPASRCSKEIARITENLLNGRHLCSKN